jgi:hypothetical protein
VNIFYLDRDPVKCAEYHVDKHCIKMILEYAQLLSTAHRVLDGVEVIEKKMVHGSLPIRWRNTKKWKLLDSRETLLYSATHINHPSAVWARQNKDNYCWLHSLLCELCKEYTYRYGKTHKCQEIGLVDKLAIVPYNLSDAKFTQPTPAMPDDCKVPGDSLQSYRNYYVMSKSHLWSWKGKINSRTQPQWFIEMVEPLSHGYS